MLRLSYRLIGAVALSLTVWVTLTASSHAAVSQSQVKGAKSQIKPGRSQVNQTKKVRVKSTKPLVRHTAIQAKISRASVSKPRSFPLLAKKQDKPEVAMRRSERVTTTRMPTSANPILPKVVSSPPPLTPLSRLENAAHEPVTDGDRATAKEACLLNGKVYLLADCKKFQTGQLPLASTTVGNSL